jgi:hypothetical protein
MFSAPPIPYKIWNADVWKCKSCGNQVVAGFGQKPLAEHFEKDFSEYLDMITNSQEAKDGWLLYDYENPVLKEEG